MIRPIPSRHSAIDSARHGDFLIAALSALAVSSAGTAISKSAIAPPPEISTRSQNCSSGGCTLFCHALRVVYNPESPRHKPLLLTALVCRWTVALVHVTTHDPAATFRLFRFWSRFCCRFGASVEHLFPIRARRHSR